MLSQHSSAFICINKALVCRHSPFRRCANVIERELKLYIPPTKQSQVAAALSQYKKRQNIHLAAQYFDTPQRCLAKRFAALRLRLENDQWVQTLKMRGEDELSNVELNHPRPEAVLDLSLYEGTVAAALFTQLAAPLELRYHTDVQRQTAIVKTGESKIEIALDIGCIKAKTSQLAISEIEFELKKGNIKDLFSLASDWLKTHELIIELRSKSERGDALYENTTPEKAVHGARAGLAIASKPFRLPKTTEALENSLTNFYFDSSSGFLSQIIRNAAFLSGVDQINPSPELHANYLTLMRVGMRRLRSCRQLFKPWLTKSEEDYAKKMRKFYKQFGLSRDKDMLWLEMQPKLVQAGLPHAKKQKKLEKNRKATRDLAGSQAFQLCLLGNLAQLVRRKSLQKSAYSASAPAKLQYRLHRSLQRIQTQGRSFKQLSAVQQHDLRNDIKRLRYNLEALKYPEDLPLYEALAKAQDHLGDLCDAYVALDWYEKNAISQDEKAFAHSWLDDKIMAYIEKAHQTLGRLQEQAPPVVYITTN